MHLFTEGLHNLDTHNYSQKRFSRGSEIKFRFYEDKIESENNGPPSHPNICDLGFVFSLQAIKDDERDAVVSETVNFLTVYLQLSFIYLRI